MSRGIFENEQSAKKKIRDNQKPKIYTLTDQQIAKLKADAIQEASEKAFIAVLALPLLTLRDEFDFGQKRLERFMDRLMEKYKCFDEGYVTLEDLKQVIEEETGMKVLG